MSIFSCITKSSEFKVELSLRPRRLEKNNEGSGQVQYVTVATCRRKFEHREFEEVVRQYLKDVDIRG